MPVNIGDPILAADYNTLANLVNSWFSDGCTSCSFGDANQKLGWGGSAVSTVTAGDIIYANDFNQLINRINIASGIVDTTSAIAVLIQKFGGDTILASDYNTIEDEANKVIPFQNNIYAFETSIHAGTTDQRTTSWSNLIDCTVRYSFTDFDEARYFFNSGGELLISLDLTGGTTGNAMSWDITLNNAGTIAFDFERTTQSGSGGIPTEIGFYDSTSSYQNVFTQNATGAYAANQLRIQAKVGPSGDYVDIKVILDDLAVGSVDGTTTMTAQYRKLDDQSYLGTSLSITAPSVSMIDTFE